MKLGNFIPSDWNYVRLGDISEALIEKAGSNKYETLSISAGIGFVNQANKFGKELSGKQYEKYIVLRKGDFSYNKGNSKKYPQGCIYQLKDRDEAAVPNVFESFRLNKGINDYYEQLFVSGFLNPQFFAKINHGVRDDGLLNLKSEDFYSCYVPFPPLPEQQKIAEILSTQDKLIELQEKKTEQLKELKKGYLQKMFPKKESKYPEIRFKGFTGAWEQRKLHEIVSDISTGKSVNSDDIAWDKESICILKTSCVSYDLFDVNECKKVIPEECDYVKCPVEANTIIVSRMNTPDRVGACGYVSQSQPNLFLPDRLWKLKMKEAINTYLVYVLLTSDSYKTKMRGIASGTSGSMHNIPKDKFLEIDILLPSSFEEQQIISAFFDSLNNLITLHQRKLEEEKQKKKSLMQLLLTGKVRVNI